MSVSPAAQPGSQSWVKKPSYIIDSPSDLQKLAKYMLDGDKDKDARKYNFKKKTDETQPNNTNQTVGQTKFDIALEKYNRTAISIKKGE